MCLLNSFVVVIPSQPDRNGRDPIVVIGGGPGGLTAAYELVRRGHRVIVYEADSQVGGISKTVEYKGFRFDLGGHRFFTKVKVVREMWRMMLGEEFLRRPRFSRIYYDGKFFAYPLKAVNVVRNLGLLTSVSVGLSYLRARMFPVTPEVSFVDWITNRFGRRLYEIFFKGYTEKVWGIPCTSISSAWAAQRIKGLSFATAVINMLLPARGNGAIKTLIDEFEYPRLGPGMMWEAFAERIEESGGNVVLNTRVRRLIHNGVHVGAVEVETADGRRTVQAASHVVSTMPLRHLVNMMEPELAPEVRESANRLSYRDFLVVAIIIRQENVFPDNWIYIHDDRVKVGRIQNFKNWSSDMVPDSSYTCLGLEYFCFAGDGLWASSEEELVTLATQELSLLGIVFPDLIVDGTVVRVPKAYPVYDEGYEGALEVLKGSLAGVDNLQMVGRNGMHKYNNQDHAMLMYRTRFLGHTFALRGMA